MDLFALVWGLLVLLAVSGELSRWYYIYKAKRDEKRRRKRKEAFNLEDNSKPKRRGNPREQ